MSSCNSKAIFRCDSSSKIGSGHVFRCRTLARKLKKLGCNIVFLCREEDGDLIKEVEKEFNVLKLKNKTHKQKKKEEFVPNLFNQDKTSLPEKDQNEDAMECRKLLKNTIENEEIVIIVDHYGLDKTWEETMREHHKLNSVRIMAIDDLANREHSADILLDQNYFGDIALKRYDGLTTENTDLYLGPKYSLLHEQYQIKKKWVIARKSIKRIVIFYSATDPFGITKRALQVLCSECFRSIFIDVVLSKRSQYYSDVRNIISKRGTGELHSDIPYLTELFLKADLALGAGGSTTWERCCLGLPCITTDFAHNQRQLTSFLEQNKYTMSIIFDEDFEKNLHNKLFYIGKSSILNAYSKRVSALTKGDGANIVAKSILKLSDK